MIKLLIADDHSHLVEGVKHVLANTHIKVVGCATEANKILDAYKSLNPDLVLCDINLGFAQSNSVTILKSLLNYDVAAKVIIFSLYDKDTLIQQSYDEGAKCFLSKTVPSTKLIDVITQVNEGVVFLPLAMN